MPINFLKRLNERKKKLESGDIEDSRNMYYESEKKEEEIKSSTPVKKRKNK